jgi:signal transduction histidine kinase
MAAPVEAVPGGPIEAQPASWIESLSGRLLNPSSPVTGPVLRRGGGYGDRSLSTNASPGLRSRSSEPAGQAFPPDGYRAVVLLPLAVETRKVGLIQFKWKRNAPAKVPSFPLLEELGRILAIAITHRHAQVELRERVKELTCLYGIARLVAEPGMALTEILQGIVELLPPAWLYPGIASARITLDDLSCSTAGFRPGGPGLLAGIMVDGTQRGTVEVVYSEAKPELDEGPFLKEERHLIDTVAREVAAILRRRQAEEERSRLREQLLHADRLATLGQLAAGVAHEINEPLGNILGFSQLCLKTPGLPDQARKDLEKIQNASLSARDVIRKLLLFARQMPPRKEGVNLNRVIDEGLFFFLARCSRQGIAVARDLASDLPDIAADPTQLNQVLVNLVVNAMHAMPHGGRLRVATNAVEGSILLTVEDTGDGMDPDVLEKIFTPFFTTKDVGQGTGLGLSVVHGIVTSHGGTIRVGSRPGRGTRFEIRLPVKHGEQNGEPS